MMENTAYRLESVMAELGVPTLKAIALVFDQQPVRLYSVAKTPKEGEIYDAKQYNWEAIERYILRRLDPDNDLATLEDVVTRALEIDKELVLTDRRRRSEPAGSAKVDRLEVDGRDMPVRKFRNFEIDYEGPFCHPAGIHVVMLKKDPNVYGFVYQTRGYTLLQPVDRSGAYCSETPKLISNNLLNMYGLGPSWLAPEVVEKKYKEQDALAAAIAETIE